MIRARRYEWLLGVMVAAACAADRPVDDPGAAAPATVPAPPDTARVQALRDSAEAALVTLLARPTTATFDSVRVVQAVGTDERPGVLAVCGRFGGDGGAPARFIYQSRWTVFVEEAANREQFREVWGRSCVDGIVLVRE